MRKNIKKTKLIRCGTKPMTGFFRDGYCRPGLEDYGVHTVCAKMDKKFLDFTKKEGNDLSSVVKAGQKWCLCQSRWNDAYLKNKAPYVIEKATHSSTKKKIIKNINVSNKKIRKSKSNLKYNKSRKNNQTK